MTKSRLNISLDKDLVDFAKSFAAENRMSVSDVITQYLLGLKRRAMGETDIRILSHPAFYEAMEEVRARLRSGEAEWLTFDEVFDD